MSLILKDPLKYQELKDKFQKEDEETLKKYSHFHKKYEGCRTYRMFRCTW